MTQHLLLRCARKHTFSVYALMFLMSMEELTGRQLKSYVDIFWITTSDVLHTHGYKNDIIGLLATMQTNCRIVSTPHGWNVQAGSMVKLYEATERAIYPFFNAVAPLSADIYKGLKAIPGLRKKLYLIHNGVDIDEVDEVKNIANEIDDGKTGGNFVVGYIGQLIERKRIKILLKAFAKLNIPLKKLAILGEGDQKGRLEHYQMHLY